MKHLFYIHSYITYIVSMSAIAEFNLSRSDVVFLYGRGFTYSDASTPNVIIIPAAVMVLNKVPSYGSRFLLLEKYREITALDNLINQATDNHPFIAYLPLTKNFMMQLVATHGLCVDVSFIEEGLLSYTNRLRKPTNAYFSDSLKGRIARSLRYLNHGNRSFYFHNYPHSLPAPLYMIHAPQPGLADDLDVRVLSSVIVPAIDKKYTAHGGHLFIIENVVEAGITSMSAYVHALDDYVEIQLARDTEVVWLRFRPGTSPSAEIMSVFTRRKIDVSIIPDDVCVESMLFHSDRMTIVGLHSSLLFYAAMWGHKSISLLRRLFSVDEVAESKYKKHMTIPPIFFEQVTLYGVAGGTPEHAAQD